MFMRFGDRRLRSKAPFSYLAGDAELIASVHTNFSLSASNGVKRSFDIVSATAASLLLLPLFAIMIAVVFVMQGRPIFIRHRRVGLNGKSFECLKFRTMVNDAQRVLENHLEQDRQARTEWEASRKLKVDPRVTPVGRVLRKSSVDELPQLINIMRGDMSIVGPRPIVQDEVKFYGAQITDYYKVRPGLTGLWQISGRSDTSYNRRVVLDAEYTRSRSFAGDLKIIMKTIPAVLRFQGSY